jgi:hypothetical protein
LEEALSSRHQTEETLKNGTSTNNHSPLEIDLTTNLGTLRTQERLETCKSGAPTQDGGKSSSTLDITSLTSRTRRFSMSSKERMLKDKKLLSGRDTTDLTRDGRLFILTQERVDQPRDLTEALDGTSTDYSILDLDSQ